MAESGWTRPLPPAWEENIGQVVEALGFEGGEPGSPAALFHRSSPQATVDEGGWPEDEIIVFEGILDPELSGPTVLWPQTMGQTPSIEGVSSPIVARTLPTPPYLCYTESVSPTPSGFFGGDIFYTPEFVSPSSSGNFGGDSFYTASEKSGTPSFD